MPTHTRKIIEVELTYTFRYDPQDWGPDTAEMDDTRLQGHYLDDARAAVENGGENPARWTTRIITESTTA
jgi:hypothetical protein